MSDLLLMASLGLPRNGLVLLADPYRDVYGRNVLPTSVVTALQSQNMTATVAGAETTLMETEATTYHRVLHDCVNGVPSGVSFVFAFEVKPIGYTELVFAYLAGAYFGGKALLSGDGGTSNLYSGTTMTCVPLGDGFYKVVISATASGAGRYFYGGDTPSHTITPTSYAGDTSKGWVFRNFQLNLGSTLYPYSAPAGAPGTLQTSLDYSGHGNNLTLGADTNASTDDPAFTGTAWRFDGGDYLTGPTTPMWSNTAGMTVMAVWTIPSGSTTTNICGQYSPSTSKRAWYLGQSGYRCFSVQPNPVVYDPGNSALLGGTYIAGTRFFAGRWLPSVRTQYIEGNFAAQAVATTPAASMVDNSVPLDIGRYGQGLTYAENGSTLSLLAIYNRYLVDSEISRAYRYLKSLMAGRGVTVA